MKSIYEKVKPSKPVLSEFAREQHFNETGEYASDEQILAHIEAKEQTKLNYSSKPSWMKSTKLSEDTLSSFKKDDSSKNRLELIEPKFIEGLGAVLTLGATKYAPNNWKNASEEDIERIKGALLRHIMTYLSGDKIDEESKVSHLYHASFGLMTLDYFDRKALDE